MVDRKQITVWVSEGQIEDWNRYQEELGFLNRSEMIRRSVEYYYREQTKEAEDDGDVVDARLDDVADKLDRVRAEVMDIRREQLERNDIDDIANEIQYRLGQDENVISTSADISEKLSEGLGIDWDDEEVQELAEEQFLSGFDKALRLIQDEQEKQRLKAIFEEQREELID